MYNKKGERIEKTIDDEKNTVNSRNPIVRWYCRKKFNIAVNIACLNREDVILDFGCGNQWLKGILPEYNITGYDVNPVQSDVEDYKTLKPTKIFVMDVFEHIPINEVNNILDNFIEMNNNFELIIAIPTENFISRKARKLLGKPERVRDHITNLKELLGLISKKFKLVKKHNFLTVSYIAKFKPISQTNN